MKRLSTDAEYLNSGKIVLDADGIPFEPASKGYADQRIADEKWRRPTGLNATNNLDTMVGRQWEGLYSSATATAGLPVQRPGWVSIIYNGADARTEQEFWSPTEKVRFVRYHAGGSWGSWETREWYNGRISSGSLNDYSTPSAWTVSSTSVGDIPAAVTGTLEVTLDLAGNVHDVLQKFVSNEPAPRTWMRQRKDNTWGAWVPQGHHQMRMSYSPVVTSENGSYIMTSQTLDRKIGFNSGSHAFRITRDEGETWEDYKFFYGSMVGEVVPLANGEIMVIRSGAGNYQYVTISEGFSADPYTATWTDTLQGAAPEVKFPDWSVSTHDNMIFLLEYGPKAGGPWNSVDYVEAGQNARYLYMSLDYGKTWETIFDLNEWLLSQGDTIENHHPHGVAWDKHWNRIWITFGDRMGGDGTNGILYSDDLGKTWQIAVYHAPGEDAPFQVVGIAPMKDAVIFADDNSVPSGPMRISRSQGKNPASWKIEKAFVYPHGGQHLCHQILQYDTPAGGEVALFAYGSEGVSARPYLLGTQDGFTFTVLWEDEVLPAGRGLRKICGPTLTGQLHATNADQRVSGMVTKLSGPITVPAPVVQRPENAHEHSAGQITGLHHYRGTGSPEGEVTAPVGATYVDEVATAGAIRWIKTSGTGNTGWSVQYGETGTRDVSNLIDNASGELAIFRTGNVVFMDATSVTPTEDLTSGGLFINNLPSGFRPTMRRNFSLPSNPSGGTPRSAFQLPAGAVGVWSPSPDDHYHLHLSWNTSDSWPTTLPGTPA